MFANSVMSCWNLTTVWQSSFFFGSSFADHDMSGLKKKKNVKVSLNNLQNRVISMFFFANERLGGKTLKIHYFEECLSETLTFVFFFMSDIPWSAKNEFCQFCLDFSKTSLSWQTNNDKSILWMFVTPFKVVFKCFTEVVIILSVFSFRYRSLYSFFWVHQ